MTGTVAWPTLGARVAGTYLGRDFTGKVVDIAFPQSGQGRTYTVLADADIEVVQSALMSMRRRRVTATIAADGTSVDHKGRPNGIMALRVAEPA